MNTTKHRFNPALLLAASPEMRADVECPHCGCDSFVGIDLNAALTQRFTPPDNYHSYDDEIGDYEVVTCHDCGRVVWYDQEYFRPDPEIDAVLAAVAALPEAVQRHAQWILAMHRVSTMLAWSDEVVATDDPHQL